MCTLWASKKKMLLTTLTSIFVSIFEVEPLSEHHHSNKYVNHGLQCLVLGKDRVRFRLAGVWWRICLVDLRHILYEGPRKPFFVLHYCRGSRSSDMWYLCILGRNFFLATGAGRVINGSRWEPTSHSLMSWKHAAQLRDVLYSLTLTTITRSPLLTLW
jgi:hypothetical protein